MFNEAMADDPHGGLPTRAAGAPLAEARSAIVLVHGRGATAESILPLGPELAGDGVAFLAPQAANGTWYPNSFLAPIERNEPWLSSALRKLAALLAEIEGAGIDASSVVVAGFSQGACLATEFVARHPVRYRALLGFTGGLIGPPGTAFGHSGDLAETPVYLSAGDPDPHVPWSRMEETRDALVALRANVTLRRWPGRPHTILREEVDEARSLLASAINPKRPGEPPSSHPG